MTFHFDVMLGLKLEAEGENEAKLSDGKSSEGNNGDERVCIVGGARGGRDVCGL